MRAPRGRLLGSRGNPPFELLSRAGRRLSQLLGEPARWPTRGAMCREVEAAGFRVESQQLVLRVPGTLLLPSFLTVAQRPE